MHPSAVKPCPKKKLLTTSYARWQACTLQCDWKTTCILGSQSQRRKAQTCFLQKDSRMRIASPLHGQAARANHADAALNKKAKGNTSEWTQAPPPKDAQMHHASSVLQRITGRSAPQYGTRALEIAGVDLRRCLDDGLADS